MRYLITGHKGDIGSSLVSLLKVNGHEVIPLDLGTHEKADRILHLAAKSFPADNEQILSSNIIFHNNLISYAEQIGVKELYAFKKAHPNVDTERFMNESSATFQAFILNQLKQILDY